MANVEYSEAQNPPRTNLKEGDLVTIDIWHPEHPAMVLGTSRLPGTALEKENVWVVSLINGEAVPVRRNAVRLAHGVLTLFNSL